MLISFTATSVFSQSSMKGGISNVSDTTCFCCNPFYNLVQPRIQGITKINCGTTAKFSIAPCPNATIVWSVSPSVSFTGQGTTSISLPATTSPGNYIIKVTLSCGGKSIESQTFNLAIVGPQTCNATFTIAIETLASGNVKITTTPHASTQVPGTEHWWGIQTNGSFPNCINPAVPIPFSSFNNTGVWGGYINPSGQLTTYMGTGITTGPSGYGISYAGAVVGSCIKITHYIKCCGVLYRQTQWFTTSPQSAARGVKVEPKIESSAVEMIPLNKEN